MWNVSLLRILAPPMLARYVTVPKVSVFLKSKGMDLNHSTCIWTPKLIMTKCFAGAEILVEPYRISRDLSLGEGRLP